MSSVSPRHNYRIFLSVRLYILEQCSSRKTSKWFFWVTVTHLEETEVPWCQPAQSDDHLCCWSFLDDQQPSCRWGKNCHRSTCISTKVTAFLCSLFVGLWGTCFSETKQNIMTFFIWLVPLTIEWPLRFILKLRPLKPDPVRCHDWATLKRSLPLKFNFSNFYLNH